MWFRGSEGAGREGGREGRREGRRERRRKGGEGCIVLLSTLKGWSMSLSSCFTH